MTATVTIIDSTYDSNNGAGRKDIYATVSMTNPYTAGGDSIDVSSWFPNKCLGGHQVMVKPTVAIALAGPAAMSVIRADTSSTSTVLLQLLNAGLTGTSSAGLFVDNTVANISGTTLTLTLHGY